MRPCCRGPEQALEGRIGEKPHQSPDWRGFSFLKFTRCQGRGPGGGESPTERLAPVVQVEGEALFLDTLGLRAFPSADLRGAVTSLRSEAPRIWSALGYARHGY